MPDATLHIIPKSGRWGHIEANSTFVFLLESPMAGKSEAGWSIDAS
jgi:hypothetical protein